MKNLVIKSKWVLLPMVASLCFLSCKEEPKTLSYAELVGRLTDLKSLAKLPEVGEKSAMWSSYDRASKIHSVTGEFIDWDANIDGLEPQYIRKEGDNEVLAEMEGPGAVVRIWSASPKQGKVKIFIDGKEEPVINASFIDYFGPSIPAFNYPELVYETNARGYNNYVPIPYQKSCKIVAEPGWGQYYHFNYISFPKGTQLEAFRPDPTETGKKALDKVNRFFAQQMGEYPQEKQGFQKETVTVALDGGAKKTVVSLAGKGAIAILKAKFNNLNPNASRGPAPDKEASQPESPAEPNQAALVDDAPLDEIMRKTILEIRWDGEESPSVWTPLGDFFGTSPGWNEYRTLPMGMTDEWMYSYWYMPYGKGAEITLHNMYDSPVSVTLEIQREALEDDIDGYGRFHAKWHRDLKKFEGERWPDWKLLETHGRGRFLGAHLLVWNPKGGSAKTGGPGYWWWGEGDEKFFIDGETFPSTFGTGTEDYFGYAWCDPSVFEEAFHSQTLDNDNMGYQPMNRWQITDNVPFQSSFDGYLEKYFPNEHPTQYSTVVYWYLNTDGKDPLGAVPEEELYGWETPYKVFKAANALEAENMVITENTGGWASTDVWANENLFETVSGHKILQWITAKDKENTLQTTFKWPQRGRYEIYANLVKQKDGGEFDVTLNGKKLKRLDCHAPSGEMETERIKLGRVRLQAGQPHQMEFRWREKGDTPKALRIDYLEFIKI